MICCDRFTCILSQPGARDANKKLGDGAVRYAYTVEGYTKWGQAAYITSQATKRGNLSNIYKTLNYFLGGEYRAYQAKERGYGGPNMDLGCNTQSTTSGRKPMLRP